METVVCGKKIEYGVDEATGVFKATYNGEQYKHVTLAGLKAQLERMAKKKPLNIKIYQVEHDYGHDGFDLSPGLIVGIHSGNNNLLVKFEGENETQQVRGHHSLLKGSTNIPKLKALYAASRKAHAAYEKFKEANKFDRYSLDDKE